MSPTIAAERALLALAVIIILGSIGSVVIPFTRAGFPSGHDASAHITYTYLFDRALSQGQFPVRWTEWVRPGEGQPLFNFYQPGLYYLVQIPQALGLPLSVALKTTVAVLWSLGGLLTYLWLRPLGGLPAGAAAALFVLSPYLIVDAFVRAAYPELTAVSIAPGLFWSIDRMVRSRTGRGAWLVACFTAAMLLCHVLSSLIFGPVAALYAVHRLVATRARPRMAAWLAAGAVLGFGLAAFFVIPSQLELDHVAIDRMTSGYSDYRDHFVYLRQLVTSPWGYGASVPGRNDGISFEIGTVPLAVLALAAIGMPLGLATRRVPHVGAMAFWLAVVGIVSWLITPSSQPVWRAVPPLGYLQFPWRYFMVVSVGVAALAALLLSTITSRVVRAGIVITIVGLHWQLERQHLQPLTYFPKSQFNIDSTRWPEIVSVGLPAFIERGFTPRAGQHEAPQGIDRWSIIDGAGDVRVVELADHRLTLEVDTADGMRLRINSRAFPGWIVLVDGAPVPTAIDRDYGFLHLAVPPGTHRVEARFTNTPVRTAANAISIASAGVWLAGLVWHLRTHRTRRG